VSHYVLLTKSTHTHTGSIA